tara:strand:+ start:359 stop:679 length:321 start_codon:yes stop_codon:yes gene_type:complete
MSRMSYIAYLCEKEDRDAIVDELNMPDLMTLTGKSPEEIADGFIAAYQNIRLQKNNPAFSKLNEIQDEMLEYEKDKDEDEEDEELSQCCSAKIIYHDICSLCKEHV